MNGWKECKLREHVLINARSIDKYYPYKEIEYLDTGSITEGKIDSWQNFNLKDAPSRARRIVKDNDIVLSMVRPIQRHYGFISKTKPNSVVSTGFVVLTAKDSIEPFYLYSFLTQDDITEYLDVVAEGSTSAYPAFTPDVVEKLSILLPPLSEQRAIAGVLSSLDDKIDLLHRQNKTLEGMAEALWRKMFVEEVDAGWKADKLGDIASVQNGFAFKSSEYVAFEVGYLEVLKMGHIQPGGGLRTNPKTDFVPREDRLTKYVLSKGDIVMAMTDMKDNVVILGNPAMIDFDDKYVLNQRVARIYLKADNKLIDSHLLYVQLKDPEFIAILQSKANSGVQVNLSTESIKDCDILIPPIDVQREKGSTIIKAYLKKENNDYQIRTLSRLRDTLLPKLMSGEVRVKM